MEVPTAHVRPHHPIERELRKQSIATRYTLVQKKEKKALLIEVSVPSDFGLNNAEIKKITKYLPNQINTSSMK